MDGWTRTARADGHPALLTPAGYHARFHHRVRERLPIWVIYRPITREYPGRWVARLHVTLPTSRPTRMVMTHDTLAELRCLLPEGLIRVERHPNDVPEIEEVWT